MSSMRAIVVVFPGSNCDRDAAVALRRAGWDVSMVWHGETECPPCDLAVLPGGFSYGDYLRGGAMAAHSPIMRPLAERIRGGLAAIGICNGFQILTEAGLLPGVLARNAGLRFVCRPVTLTVETADSPFTHLYRPDQRIAVPVANNEGRYAATPEDLKALADEDRIAFRYAEEVNGSIDQIAGILSPNRRVLGMMPHPERAVDPAHGGDDGAPMFDAALAALAA